MFDKLKEWAINYVKNRDLLDKKIVSINDEESGFLVEYKDKTHRYIVEPELNDLSKLSDEHQTYVIVSGMKNIDFVVKHWKELIKYEKLSIIFVDLGLNKRWILNPYTHNKVCDDKSLKNGLVSLYNSLRE